MKESDKRREKNMVIGITGATGGLGRRMSEILLERGYEIRCLVRRNSKHDFLVKEGIELVSDKSTILIVLNI